MAYSPENHHRRSIRLKGYDYSQAGLYFISICTKDRECLFGKIEDGEMGLNAAGKIASDCWLEIPRHFPNVCLHQYVIMPNHVHGILEIKNVADVSVKNSSAINNPDNINVGAKNFSPLHSPSKTVGSIVRGFKIGVSKWVHENTNLNDVWHSNYYKQIIHDDQSYQTITKYILNNPAKWTDDKFHN